MGHSIDSPFRTYSQIFSFDLFFDIAAENHHRIRLVPLVPYSTRTWRLVADDHKESCPPNQWRIMTRVRSKKHLIKLLSNHHYCSTDKQNYILPGEDTHQYTQTMSTFVSFKEKRPHVGPHIEVKTFSGLTIEAIYQPYLDLEGKCDSWRPLD